MSEKSLKKVMFSSLLWKFGERISAQMISLIVSIVLARLLAPEEYGVVTLVMVFITIANVFVSSGFGNALIQKKDADNIDFSSVFFINIGVGFALYCVLFFCAPAIASFYKMPELTPILRVLGIRIVVASINTVQQAYVSRHMLFKRFFWSTLFGTLLSGIVGILMAYKGFGAWALVAQYLTNTCTDTVVLWFTVCWRPVLKCSWKRAKALFSYGWKLLVSGLLDTGYRQMRSLIIGKRYTASDLAFYNQGDKYPSLIVTNINTSISSVLFPAMSKYQDDPEKVKDMTRRAIQVSAYVMWPAMIGLGAIAQPFVRLILTEKWLPCVPYLRIFCITYGLWPIHTANLQAINAMGRSDLFLKLEIIKKSMGLIALFIAMWISPFAMALSLIVTDIIACFVNASPNVKLLNYSISEQVKDLMQPFVLAIIMAAVIYPIYMFRFSDWITIVMQIVAGGCIYAVESIVVRPSGFKYIVKTLPSKKRKKGTHNV